MKTLKTFKLTILSYMQLVIFSWGNRNLMKAEGERGDTDNRVLIHLTSYEGNAQIDKALRFHSSFIQYLYRLLSTKSD